MCVCVCLYIVHGNLHNEQCVPRHSISKKPVAFAVNSCYCCELYVCVRFVNSVKSNEVCCMQFGMLANC